MAGGNRVPRGTAQDQCGQDPQKGSAGHGIGQNRILLKIRFTQTRWIRKKPEIKACESLRRRTFAYAAVTKDTRNADIELFTNPSNKSGDAHNGARPHLAE
ncbi:hypothetical protein DESC_610385 [Desulfosarcina cetonica]|nr:hypothetical protein DESC_610385 [Desulfosarcina cetonica]